MKGIKKKIVSGLLATAMMVGVLPMGLTPVSAAEITIEQAYFQVLDDIVDKYGMNHPNGMWLYDYGLMYAKLLDFDQDGTKELVVAYGNDYGGFVEIWDFRNQQANCVKQIDIYSNCRLESLYFLNVLQLEDGSYCLVENGGHMGSQGGVYSYTNAVEYSNGMITETMLREEADHYLDENSYVYYEHGSVIPSDQYKLLTGQYDKDKYSIDEIAIVDLGLGGYLVNDTALYHQLEYASYELEDLKKQLPYTGYLEKMQLSAEQALAMAEEIEAYYSAGSMGTWVALFDFGTGTPGMWLLNSPKIPEFDWLTHKKEYGTYSEEWEHWFTGYSYVYSYDSEQSKLMEVNSEIDDYFEWIRVGETSTSKGYRMISGVPEPHYTIERDFTNGMTGEVTDYIYEYMLYISGFLMEGDYLAAVIEEATTDLQRIGITNYALDRNKIKVEIFDEFDSGSATFYLYQGQIVDLSLEEYFDLPIFSDVNKLRVNSMYGDSYATGNWADGREVANVLRAYAQKSQFRFNFPEFSQNTEVTNLFSDLQLSGTMMECYEIVNQYYYVIMEENGLETAYIIRYIKRNGEVICEILSQSSDFLTEDQLQDQGNRYLFDSNITIDGAQLENFTSATEYVNYFTTALQNIGGASLNDSGKSALTQSMQDSISQFATTILNVTEEVGEIKSEQVISLVEKAEELFSGFMSLLQTENEELNKELEQSVRVVLQGLDEKNWTIYLNSDLISKLDGNNLQIFLASGQQGLEVSAADLDILLKESGGLFINVQETGIDQYGISFADSEGNSIEKLSAPVKLYLPTTNEFATVMLDYAQGTENWGGQFNSGTNTIQFSTIHTGTYRIVDNSVEVNDVSDEYLSMIQFMVSKGFFEVDEYGNFNPYGTITRNDFTKTLVSMFFALDRDLSSSFLDVYEDSPYYSYIASGESRDIVAGYDDGYFYGDAVMSEEMAFTLIAQTLVDKKGYVYPEDLDSYLNTRTISGEYNDWAKKGLALTFRDNIVLPRESVTPLAELTRENAALYLYRLFTLLEERQQVNFSLNPEISEVVMEVLPEEEESSSLIAYIGIAVGVVSIISGAYLLLAQKKKL